MNRKKLEYTLKGVINPENCHPHPEKEFQGFLMDILVFTETQV